jgi:polyribonucleotide nucleotidyltransferase
MKVSDMDLVVSGSADAVVMVEAGMKEVSEEIVLGGIVEAQKANMLICDGIT